MEEHIKQLLTFYKAKYQRNEEIKHISKYALTENRCLKNIIEDLERVLEGKEPLTWEIKFGG